MYQISNLLELSHNDLGDYNNTMSKGGKKYKITFDNGRSKFTEVYMLNSTDDAIHKFDLQSWSINQLDRKFKE